MHDYEQGLNALADAARALRRAGVTGAVNIQWTRTALPQVNVHLPAREDVDRLGDYMGWGRGYRVHGIYQRVGATFRAYAEVTS